MKNLISINKLSIVDLERIWTIANDIHSNGLADLSGTSIAMFFPESSLLTRTSFQAAAALLSASAIMFPSSLLDDEMSINTKIGYISNWASCIVIRHPNHLILEQIAEFSCIPVINAMTKLEHPCEVISDLLTIKQRYSNWREMKYLYIGPCSNVSQSWADIASIFNLKLVQVGPQNSKLFCKSSYFQHSLDLLTEITSADVIITDDFIDSVEYKSQFQLRKKHFDSAKKDVIFNPTPPFRAGEVCSSDINILELKCFAGFAFKRNLAITQAAIILDLMR